MRNWLRRAEGSHVFFHNGLHGLYGFLSLGGSCHSDFLHPASSPLRRRIREISVIRCEKYPKLQ